MWAAVFCSALVFSQFGTTYSLHIIHDRLAFDVLGFHLGPETVYGLLIGWNGLLIVLAELPLTSFTLRFEVRRVMAVGYVLLGAGFAMNAFAHTISALFIAMTVFSVGEMISSPMTSAYVARLAPERMRGRYMGALALAWNASGIFGPPIGFRLFALDPRLVWFGCGLLGLAAASAIWRSGRQMEDEAPQTAIAMP